MSYQFYKILHFIGLFMIFSGLGGQLLHAINGGDRQHPGRKWLGVMHGVGLLLALVAGFGLIARLQTGFPAWIWGKIIIWVALGGLSAVAMRKQHLSYALWLLMLTLGGLAAYLAGVKPGG
jgi:hypothetical protein